MIAEADNGSFCLLPRHIDFATALAPGLLSFEEPGGAESFLAVDSGVLVKGDAAVGQPGVITGGPADQAGLQEGDILTAIDGQPIDATHQLDVTLLQHEPGDQVELSVLRGDQTLKMKVTLGVRPADIAQ